MTDEPEGPIRASDPQRAARTRADLLDRDRARAISEAFGSLAHEVRVQILSVLRGGELCVCDLAHILGISVPSMSYHLKLLRAAGLVTYRADGRMAHYRRVDSPLLEAFEAIAGTIGPPERTAAGREAGR